MTDGYRVYFLRPVGMAGPIKIGMSGCSEAQLRHYMRWSPFPLEIVVQTPGYWAQEGVVHNLFKADRLHFEWFTITPRLQRFMDDLAAGKSFAEAVEAAKIEEAA